MKYIIVTVLVLVAPAVLAWEEDCSSSQCRIYTYMDIRQSGSSESVRMFLELTDAKSIVVTALNTRTYHDRFYTTQPATYVRFNQTDYVPVRMYFNERFPGILSVDGRQVATLPVRNESQLVAQKTDIESLVQAFKLGTSATLEYASSLYGKGQKASFSLIGFTKSYNSLSSTSVLQGRTATQVVDPISVLRPLLVGNRFSVGAEDLALKENPHGSGVFVYVPQTRYSGVERLFIWFVNGNTALKLNGATHNLTPALPFPRDASLDFWEGTGLSPKNATQIGLNVAFVR